MITIAYEFCVSRKTGAGKVNVVGTEASSETEICEGSNETSANGRIS
jgi:hypothetical protein